MYDRLNDSNNSNDGITLQDKLEAITKINIPKSEKELKSILETIQLFSNVYREPISLKRYTQRNIKETKRWDMDRQRHKDNRKSEKVNNTTARLGTLQLQKRKHSNKDASTKGLGATLWQKQNDGNLKR